MMKKIGLLFLLSFGVFAQSKEVKKNSEMRIRIEKDENGKKTITEKIINTNNMSQAEQDRLATKIQDSILADKSKMAHVKVMIESQCTDDKSAGSFDNKRIEMKRSARKMGKDDGREISIRDFDEEIPQPIFDKEVQVSVDAIDGSSPHIQIHDFKSGKMIFFDGEEKGNTPKIQGIKTFLNNPNNEMLNVRFNASGKGDVSIALINLEGQTIVKEEIKDFSGEYVGQLKIGKQKGIFFVLVSQNGDGNTKRVVIE